MADVITLPPGQQLNGGGAVMKTPGNGDITTGKIESKPKKHRKQSVDGLANGGTESAVTGETKLKKTKKKEKPPKIADESPAVENGNKAPPATSQQQNGQTTPPVIAPTKQPATNGFISGTNGYMTPNGDLNHVTASVPDPAEDEQDVVPDLSGGFDLPRTKPKLSHSRSGSVGSVSSMDSAGELETFQDGTSPESKMTNGLHLTNGNHHEHGKDQTPPPSHNRSRRPSTVDLSYLPPETPTPRETPRTSRYRRSSVSSLPYVEQQTYSNPDMELFRMRLLQPQVSRTSLKDLIPDWPVELNYIEKPEYRMPEFREDEAGEAQALELRKMDPAAIYKSDCWVKELEDQICEEKELRIDFVCTYSNPNARFRWYKNKLEVFHGHKYEFFNEDGCLRLTVHRVAKEDSGRYTCQADDKETSGVLTVLEKKIQYQFDTRLPETMCLKEKSDYVLECFLSDPKPLVVWKKNDEIIEYTPNVYDVFRREKRCILRIRNIKRDYNGVKFSCSVDGDVTSCLVTVEDPEYDFVKQLADVDCYEKETAIFECEVNYEEAPTRWLKEDKPLSTDDTKYIFEEDHVRRRLHILNIQIQDEANYSCAVQNKFSSAKLFVARNKSFPEVVINERLKNMKKVENESVKLRCKVKNPKNCEISWFKDNEPLITNDRYEITNKDGKTQTLIIKSLQLTDAGQYRCRIGDRETSCTLQVDPCTVPVSLQVNVGSKPVKVNIDTVPREILVKAGKTIEVYIPYIGTPLPTMEWTKNGERLFEGDGVSWNQTPDMVCFFVTHAQRRHLGEYILQLTNDGGQEIVPITIRVIDRPRAPQGTLNVLDVYRDRCHLSWQAPEDDGGVELEYYLVEMSEIDVQDWTEVGQIKDDTQCGVPSLVTGKHYQFRVRAVNSEGQSEPLYTHVDTLAKDPWDPPSRPGQPVVVDYDRHRAEIKWTPSVSDGGDAIQKYVIEKREQEEPWQTAGMVHPSADLHAIIPNLEEGQVYQFRVCAVNQAGRGPMSEPSQPVQTKPTRIPAVIDHSSYTPSHKVKTGQEFKLEVHYSGKPSPHPAWFKDGQDVTSASELTITNGELFSTLTCSNARRVMHNALYTLSVTNDYGSDSANIQVLVISVPQRPVGPLEVTRVRSTSAVLNWKPPADNGGWQINGFVIDKLCSSSGQWEKVSGCVSAELTEFKVTRLIDGQCYMFRVRAENDLGLSEPLVTTEEIRAKNPFDCPGPPGSPLITDSQMNYISIAWTAPVTDGGAPIHGYLVERKEQTSQTWNRMNSELLKVCEFKDDNVKLNKAYEYRVIAENEGGESQPSQPSALLKAKPLREVPKVVAFGQGSSGWGAHLNRVGGNGNGAILGRGARWGGWAGRKRPEGVNDNTNILVVCAGEPINIDLQISGSPTPTVEWLKDKKTMQLSNRVMFVTDDENAHLLVTVATRSDTGLYTTLVSNEMGADSVDTYVVVLDKPGRPMNVKTDQVFADHCQLSWTCPEDDGDSPITNYVVEICEDDLSLWEKLPATLTPATQYNVKGLVKNNRYRMRVRAENLMGVGEPTELSHVVLAKDPFVKASNPGQPTIVDTDNDYITIRWTPPENDGGAPILGYNILRKDPTSGRWIQLNTELLKTCEFTDKNVEPGRIYEYRVSAVTAAGESDCSQTSGGIKAKPLHEKPKALPPQVSGALAGGFLSNGISSGDQSGSNEIRVKAGQPLTIRVPISGSPTPTVTWMKNGQLVPPSSRVEQWCTDDEAILSIKQPRRDDSGNYTACVMNAYGQDMVEVKITIIDKPGNVDNLEVTDMGSDHCTLSWTAPIDNGGLDITEYVIEKCEEGENRWYNACSGVGSMITGTSYVVKDLQPNKKYKFRLRAKNLIGLGDAVETTQYYLTSDVFLPPSFSENSIEFVLTEGDTLKQKIPCKGTRPIDVKLVSVTKEHQRSVCRLKLVDYDDSNLVLYIKEAIREDSGSYSAEVTNSSVVAKLDIKLSVRGVCVPCEGPLVVSNMTNENCSLHWRPPKDDGGSKILNFVVQKKEQGKPYWTVAVPCVKGCETDVQGLVPGKTYQFRVAAVNSIGTGQWLSTETPLEAKMPYGVPSAPDPPVVADTTKDSVFLQWNKPTRNEHITGYYIEKKSVDGDIWVRVNPQAPVVGTSLCIGNLAVDRQYEFRLIAVNKAGESRTSEACKPVIIRDVTALILPQFVVPLSSLECLQGRVFTLELHVTGQPEPVITWYKGGKELAQSNGKYEMSKNGEHHSLTVRQATPKDADEYVAKATNSAGSRMSRCSVIIKYAPIISVPPIYQQSSVFDKGQTIVIKLGLQGYPRPSIKWTKECYDGVLSDTYKFESSESHATLIIENASQRDTGYYRLQAVNKLGQDEANIKIVVNDVSDPPRFLTVDNILHDSLVLNWKPPLKDGGSVVTQYTVEKLYPTNNTWIKCGTTRFCEMSIGQLLPGTGYQFRVLAENIYGLSEPCEPTPIVNTEPMAENIDEYTKSINNNNNNSIKNVNSVGKNSSSLTSKDYDKLYYDLWDEYKPRHVDVNTDNFLDHYDVLEELGTGVAGTVYRVVEKDTGRQFVAKVVKTHSPQDKATVRNEISMMNQLHDPKLLQLYDAFDNKNKMILVMEYLSGGELLERCCEETYRMTEAEVIHYIRQVCDSLLIMHDQNILHLGLKLENLLCKTRTSRDIKLIDFSLSARLNPDENVSVSTAAADFVAPEVVDHEAVGFYTDMWSVGVLAYALLSGMCPFTGEDDVETMRNISKCNWKFDADAFSIISEEGKDFISKLLIRTPQRRMTVYEALEHAWLSQDHADLNKRIPASRYIALRDRIRQKYAVWPTPMPAIGIIANFSSVLKHRPKENKIYESRFDRREAMPRFIQRPHNCVTTEGGTVTFKCQVLAASPPIVTWHYNNTVLNPSIKYLPKYSGRHYELKVGRVKMSDKGEYIVRAENSWGRVEKTVFLNVQAAVVKREMRASSVEPSSSLSRSDRNLSRMSSTIDRAERYGERSSPSFSFPLRDRFIQDGIGVKLLACVEAHPAPKISWFKDGKPLDNKDKYDIEYLLGICSLEVPVCRPVDAGTYTCTATNTLGTASTTCTVTVKVINMFQRSDAQHSLAYGKYLTLKSRTNGNASTAV